MARIELRDCTVRLKDGFGGSALVNDTPQAGDVTMEIDTLTNLTNGVTVIPVGARFSVGSTTYTVTGVNSNEVVTVTVDADSGTFTLTFGGETTAAIEFDAAASAVQSAMEALASVGAGNVVVSGNAGGPYRIEFQGDLAATDVGTVTADGSGLSGSTPSIGVVETQQGGPGVNEVQTITLTNAESGTFTLTYSGETTADIAYDAEASVVQTALEALATIGAGQVSVTGDVGGPWTVEFTGTLAETNVDMLTADDSGLSGSTAWVVVAVTHGGGMSWQLTFAPAIPATDVPLNDDAITLLPQQLEIKIGEGNLTYTERV